VFSLKNAGVGIPDKNPNVSADILTVVKEYAGKIAAGTLKVSETPAK